MSAATPENEQAQAAEQALPSVRVERGNPTPAQLAALTAVLSAAGGGEGGSSGDGQVRRWSSSARTGSPHPGSGPGGWRASGMPS